MQRILSARSDSFVREFQVIIGHGPNCNDGATAMWSVWRVLDPEYRAALAKEGGFYSKPFDDAETSLKPYLHPNSVEGAIRMQEKGFHTVFVFSQPNMPIAEKLVRGKNVLVLDLDMGDALIPLVEAAKSVFICDHHDTSQTTIFKHSEVLLNTYRNKFAQLINTSKRECGATLAWRFTHSADIPAFVQVVRIGDTWQWSDHPELHAKFVLKSLYVKRAFRSFPDIEATFQSWDRNFHKWVEHGRIIHEHETALVKQAAKQCNLGYMQAEDGTVYTVAYVQGNLLVSEIGAAMRWYAEQRFKVPIDFCAIWKYAPRHDRVIVSLRDPSPNLKLGQIARTIKSSDGTGGGHVEAAGFSFIGIENFKRFILPYAPVDNTPTTAPTLTSTTPIPIIETSTLSEIKTLPVGTAFNALAADYSPNLTLSDPLE